MSLSRFSTSKIYNLIEYSTILDDAIIESTVLPLIIPYNIYRKYGTFSKGVRSLMIGKNPYERIRTVLQDGPLWSSGHHTRAVHYLRHPTLVHSEMEG